MRNRSANHWVVEPYRSFDCDQAGQQYMKTRGQHRERLVMLAFIILPLALGGAVLAAAMHCLVGLALCALFFVAAWAFGTIQLLTFKPALACTNCGQRMRTVWEPLPDGRSGEYLICETCHTYVCTYRTLR